VRSNGITGKQSGCTFRATAARQMRQKPGKTAHDSVDPWAFAYALATAGF
jgi:hypothetical protein